MNIQWDNYLIKNQEDDVRKEFEGIIMINPITGR
jgi:uncharacterized membrane protein